MKKFFIRGVHWNSFIIQFRFKQLRTTIFQHNEKSYPTAIKPQIRTTNLCHTLEKQLNEKQSIPPIFKPMPKFLGIQKFKSNKRIMKLTPSYVKVDKTQKQQEAYISKL